MKRVLVVDDAAANRLVLVALLNRLGCDARAVADAAAARSLVESWKPSVVLTDLHLGKGESGQSLAESLRLSPGGADLRIGLMSGDAIDDRKGNDVFDAVLEKPITVKELTAFLQLGKD